MLSENLVHKIGVHPGDLIGLVNAPADFQEDFRRLLRDGTEMSTHADGNDYDVILWWPDQLDDLDARLADLAHRIHPDGAVWIVIPKKKFALSRGIDFTWEAMQNVALKTDLVDNKSATFSETDYGTRFVIRKDLRSKYRPA